MIDVFPILAMTDNYIWIINNTDTNHCLIVDPGEAQPVLEILQQRHLIPEAILLTHHHHDHTHGVAEIVQKFSLPVYGPKNDNIIAVTQPLTNNDKIKFAKLDLEFVIFELPGHTKGHIAYYGNKMLFPSDTLFSAGCGRVFEGTLQEMYNSLAKLAALPDDTKIYPAHEYTQANLRFALAVEPKNQAIIDHLKNCQLLQQKGKPTLPTTLAFEKRINPFLRCQSQAVIEAAQQHAQEKLTNPVAVFQVLRQWKDNF